MVPKTLKWTFGISSIIHTELLDASTNFLAKTLNIPLVHINITGPIGVPSGIFPANGIEEYSKLGEDVTETVKTVTKSVKIFKQTKSIRK